MNSLAALGEQFGHTGAAQPRAQVTAHRVRDDVGRDAFARERRLAPGDEVALAVPAPVNLGTSPVAPILHPHHPHVGGEARTTAQHISPPSVPGPRRTPVRSRPH
jgi:hypothetical protein